MCGIKYGVKSISGGEYTKQSWQAPIVNSVFFNVKKEQQEQAISNANRRWNSTEVQQSLKKSHDKCTKLEKGEQQKDQARLARAKIQLIKWLNDCLEAEYGEQFRLLQIKAKYSWKD